MATRRWTSGSQSTSQVDTVTLGNPSVGSTYTVTCSTKTFTYTAASTTAATEAAAFATAFAASTEPEFQEAACANSSGATLTFTATTPGKPFSFTYSAGGTGTPTFSGSTTTTSAGPSDVSLAANWSGNALPANGDTVYLEDSSIGLKYNLQALSAVTLAALYIRSTFTGDIGLPETNIDGATPYHEYRQTYWQIAATLEVIGDGPGQGSQRIKRDGGSVQTSLSVRNTGSSAETNLEAMQWKGTNVSNIVEVTKGSVAIAGYGGDTATVATLRIGYQDGQSSDATVRCGPGTTLTTITQTGGSLQIESAVTTLNNSGGTVTVLGSGAIGTLTNYSGTVVHLGTGTVTTYTAGPGAALSRDGRNLAGVTFTNTTIQTGASISDPGGTITFTNPISLQNCRVVDCTIDVGYNRHVQFS